MREGYSISSAISSALLLLVFCIAIPALIAQQTPQLPATNAAKAQPKEPEDELPVRLGKTPELRLNPRLAPSTEKAAQIKECIAQLAAIDGPDYGLSSTLSGSAFLPLTDHTESSAFLLADHQLKSSQALKTLVEWGHDSLPFLLTALDDKTPTQFKIEHEGAISSMWFANELWGNPVNPLESKTLNLSNRKRGDLPNKKRVDSYVVKVGDVCFIAIGQIVGRRYQAVRYQPTACIVINSPTEDAQLREQVRTIWASPEAARKLFDSLLLDYSTEGNWKEGESLDRWHVGSAFQTGAAMRLLY